MPAYVVSHLTIRDPEAMQRYITEAPATVRAFGGRYLVRGGAVEALDGRWEDERMVVVEFPSREAAWPGSALRSIDRCASCGGARPRR